MEPKYLVLTAPTFGRCGSSDRCCHDYSGGFAGLATNGRRLLSTEESSDMDGEGHPTLDPSGLLTTSHGQNPSLMPPGMGQQSLPHGSASDFMISQSDDDNAMIDVQKSKGVLKPLLLKKVEDIISAYPEETVSVLRGWMSQENT